MRYGYMMRVSEMVKRSKGLRSKTRQKMRVSPREKGKVKVTKFLQNFELGEKVGINIDPRIHKGHPHPRFQGSTCTVVGHQGNAYVLELKDGGKVKRLVVKPEHIKRLTSR